MVPTLISVSFDAHDNEVNIDHFLACLKMLEQTKLWTQITFMMPSQMSLKGGGLD
jgi:hypothetical protein